MSKNIILVITEEHDLLHLLRRAKFYCLVLEAFGANAMCLFSKAHCSVIIYTICQMECPVGRFHYSKMTVA
jgi:hypothetical protein